MARRVKASAYLALMSDLKGDSLQVTHIGGIKFDDWIKEASVSETEFAKQTRCVTKQYFGNRLSITVSDSDGKSIVVPLRTDRELQRTD